MSDLITCTFHKEDTTPWGFRLTGGSDFEVPLHVVKVSQGSIADKAGLQVGDLIVKINDREAAALTHIQAHDVILAAGNDFTFTVYRGDADLLREIENEVLQENQIVEESLENEEIQKITGKISTEIDINVQVQEEQIINEKQEILQSEAKVISGQVEIQQNVTTNVETVEQSSVQPVEEKIEVIQQQEVQVSSENVKIENNTEIQNEITTNQNDNSNITTDNSAGFDIQDLLPEAIKNSEVLKAVAETELEEQKQKEEEIKIKKVEEEKKWSTFLQKPSRPKPRDKKQEELKPKEPGYRVKIVKQKKKKPEEQQPGAEEIPASEQTQEQYSEPQENMEQTEQISQELTEMDQSEMEEQIIENQEPQELSQQEETNEPGKRKGKGKLDLKSIQVVNEVEMSLEEQLAAVQRQLLALSQLPQAIQQTLDVVTSQLAKIVGETQQDSQAGQNEDGEDMTEENDYQEDDYEPELEMLDEIPEEGEEDGEERPENLGELGEEGEDGRQERLDEEHEEIPPEPEKTPEPELTEEEKEARRIEEEKLAKKQKEHEILEELHQRRLKERPSFPLTPLERPIFLPGGRRWRMPGDAAPEISCGTNMSDDAIAETISAQSEIITGTTLGDSNCDLVPSKVIATKKINFLKFEPLPVNLEHLKRSEVFKMVHGMDPAPSRGIASSRTDKPMPAASDFYNQICNESNQQPDDALTK